MYKFKLISNSGRKTGVRHHSTGKTVQRNVYSVKRVQETTEEINREVLLAKRVSLESQIAEIDLALAQMPEDQEPVDPAPGP